MTTFEEDAVDIYYNLLGYFTVKNVSFSAKEKRKGGKGRGDIDILAVYVKKNVHCMHIEVSVSITSHFPLVSKKENYDECGKIIKKFFSNDADEKIKELIGAIKCYYVYISSDFSKNFREKLRDGITRFGGEVLDIASTSTGGSILLQIKYKGKVKEITIHPFKHIFLNLLREFQENGLLKKNFQDSRLRAIQQFLHIMKKRDELMAEYNEKSKRLKLNDRSGVDFGKGR